MQAEGKGYNINEQLYIQPSQQANRVSMHEHVALFSAIHITSSFIVSAKCSPIYIHVYVHVHAPVMV